MKQHLLRLPGAILVCLLLIHASPALAQSFSLPGSYENRKQKVETPPPRTMYMYDENGKRAELDQDLGFMAIRFSEANIERDKRHEYYKRIRLVVSELNEPVLLEKGLFALRLMPGALEEKWNLFAFKMAKDHEVSYVGRVFKRVRTDKLKDLLVATDEIEAVFKGRPGKSDFDRLQGSYPLRLVSEQNPSGSAVYKTTNINVDTVDLANRIFETGRFQSVRPRFIPVQGQPVTEKLKSRITGEYIDSAPEHIKKKMSEQLKKMKGKEGKK